MWKDARSNVGNCPARQVNKAPGGYIVQGKKLSDETRAQLRDLGNDEDGRMRAGQRHRPDRELPDDQRPITEDEFGGLLRSFERTAFRLETRDSYALGYEREEFERFLAGHPTPPPIWTGGGHGWTQIAALHLPRQVDQPRPRPGRTAEPITSGGNCGPRRGTPRRASGSGTCRAAGDRGSACRWITTGGCSTASA